jgi:hypothetical protein
MKRLGALAPVLTLLAPAELLADEQAAPASGVQLSLRGPAECPTGSQVIGMVQELLGSAMSAGTPLRAQLQITHGDAGFELELETETLSGRSIRRLQSPRCETLVETAVLLIAIEHDPTVDVSNAISQPLEVIPQPAPAPVPTVPLAVPSFANPPLPTRLPRPEAPSLLGFVVNVALGAGAFELPTVHGLFAAGLGLRIDAYRIEAGIEGSLGSTTSLPADSTRGANFSLFYGTLSGCRTLLPWSNEWPRAPLAAELSGCLGLEGGVLAGQGYGVANSLSGEAPWVAPRVELRLALGLAGPLSLWSRVGAAFPVDPRRFVFATDSAEVTVVHESGPAAGRIGIGAEVQL